MVRRLIHPRERVIEVANECLAKMLSGSNSSGNTELKSSFGYDVPTRGGACECAERGLKARPNGRKGQTDTLIPRLIFNSGYR